MGQMTRTTADLIISHFNDKKDFPLTSWEKAQLAHAWLERENAKDDAPIMGTTKTFSIIENRHKGAVVLRLSEPMLLSGSGTVRDGKLESPCESFDVVMVVALPHEEYGVYDRTIIHAGVPVDEPMSKTHWAITGQFSRQVDGIADVIQAMALQGYVPHVTLPQYV
jgi:hypothetical protein